MVQTQIANEGQLPIHNARVIEVIVISVNKGAGIEGDPVRIWTQYWSTDGVFLAEAMIGDNTTVSYSVTFPGNDK